MKKRNSRLFDEAESLFSSRQFDRLAEFFEKFATAAKRELSAEERTKVSFWVSWSYCQTGRFPQAWKLAEPLWKNGGDELGLLHLAAVITCGMAEYDQTIRYASDYFEKYFSGRYSKDYGIGPELRYEVYNCWGKGLKELGRTEEAVEIFKKGIEAQEDHPAAYLNLLQLYFHEKKFSEATSLLSAGLKNLAQPDGLFELTAACCTTPQSAPLYLAALSSAGKWSETLTFLGKNSALEQQAWAKKFKAQALNGLGQWEEARFHYEQYVAAVSNDWDALNGLGTACFHLGLFDRAEECYRKALAVNPTWEEGWRNLSSSLSKLGKLEEARTSLEHYVSRVPQDKSAYGLLADLLYQKKEFGRAINFYEDFLHFHPAEKDYWVRLADCYFNLGHPQSALEFYRRAQDLEPASSEIQARIERVNQKFPAAE